MGGPEMEIVKVLGSGGALAGAIYIIYYLSTTNTAAIKALKDEIGSSAANAAKREDDRQAAFLKALDDRDVRSAADRRLYQDDLRGVVDKLLGVVTEVTVAVKSIESAVTTNAQAVRGLESAVKDLQTGVGDLRRKVEGEVPPGPPAPPGRRPRPNP